MDTITPDTDFTHAIEASEWLKEIGRLSDKLKRHQIDDIQIGMELEFHLKQVRESASFAIRKSLFIADLEKEMAQTKDSYVATTIANKIHQLHEFTPGELLMYDLLEKDPHTKDILEHSFGKGTLGHGYYDNPDILEVRLHHTSPLEICKNRIILLNELAIKMQEYGVSMPRYPTHHISFSFWKGTQNVMDASNNEHMTLGKQITEGIAKAWYDGYLLYRRSSTPHLPYIEVGESRASHLLRLAKGRLEARLPTDDAEYQRPEAVIALTLAGAVHGLNAYKYNQGLSEIVPAEPIERMGFNEYGTGHTHLLHLLNTMKQNSKTLKTQFSIGYLASALHDISVECGLITNDSPEYDELKKAVSQRLKHNVQSQIVHSYANKVLDILETLSMQGDKVISSDKNFAISHSIGFSGSFNTFQILPGYAFGKYMSRGVAVENLLNSKALKQAFSEEFFEKLRDAASWSFEKPTDADKQAAKAMDKENAKAAQAARKALQPESPAR